MNNTSKQNPLYYKMSDADMSKIKELNVIMRSFLGVGLTVDERDEWYVDSFPGVRTAFLVDSVYLTTYSIKSPFFSGTFEKIILERTDDPEVQTISVADRVVKELNHIKYLGGGMWLQLPKFRTPAELKMKLELMNDDAVAKCIYT